MDMPVQSGCTDWGRDEGRAFVGRSRSVVRMKSNTSTLESVSIV
jgi:hypothetical protein